MAKRAATLQEQLARVDYSWVKNSDTHVRCLRPSCAFNQRATYHKYVKVLNGEKYYGWFCLECHQPSPYTAEHGYTQGKPSSLQEGTK